MLILTEQDWFKDRDSLYRLKRNILRKINKIACHKSTVKSLYFPVMSSIYHGSLYPCIQESFVFFNLFESVPVISIDCGAYWKHNWIQRIQTEYYASYNLSSTTPIFVMMWSIVVFQVLPILFKYCDIIKIILWIHVMKIESKKESNKIYTAKFQVTVPLA